MTKPIALLSWVNHVDGADAILSASQEVGDLGASNLANPIVGRRWRTTSMTGWAQIDFGADKDIGVLALRFPRDTTFPTAGTVRHYLDVDGGTPGTGAAYDSTAVSIGATDGYGYHVHIPSTTKTARYWRFQFSVSGLSYLDVGRAWAGEAWRPTYNMPLGYDDEWEDLTQVARSIRSGAEFVDLRDRRRRFVFAFEALSESERDDMREFGRLTGVGKQWLLVKDTTDWTMETILGRIASTTPIRHVDVPIFSKAFEIRESL